MKYLLNILILGSFVLGGLSSCDNRDQFFNDLNAQPALLFQKEDLSTHETIDDSVKVSLKSQFPSYSIRLVVSDRDLNIKSVSYRFAQGGGDIYQDNVKRNGTIDFSSETIRLVIFPSGVAKHIIEFTVTDNFGASVTKTMILDAFNNLPPVAHLNNEYLGVISPYEYTIDATESYDKDQKYGGGLVKYKYTINGKEIITDRSSIKYVYGQPGNYQLKLAVQDADGDWSPEYSELVTITSR